MFKAKTLFIVGAGASDEVGLPVGAKLKNDIANRIDIKFGDWGRDQISGDYGVTQALWHVVTNSINHNINPYLHDAWAIRDAMPQALSIDNFLDAHQDNTRIQLIGKLGIAKAILDAERSSKLWFRFPEQQKPDLSEIQDSWYSAFFQLLTENVRTGDLENVFKNVAFITFNYDRCIQTFLFHALQNYYRISEQEAAKLLSTLTVLHPFGTVGKLNWEDHRGIAYGAEIGGQRLLEQSSQIKTFSERIEDEEALNRIRNQVDDAETIVSLGFAFHRTNLELLRPVNRSNAKRIYATALGFSGVDAEEIRKDLLALFDVDRRHTKVGIHNRLKCSELFKEYWRTLSQ